MNKIDVGITNGLHMRALCRCVLLRVRCLQVIACMCVLMRMLYVNNYICGYVKCLAIILCYFILAKLSAYVQSHRSELAWKGIRLLIFQTLFNDNISGSSKKDKTDIN